MRELRLLLWDCFLCAILIAASVYYCLLVRKLRFICVMVAGNLFFLSKLLRGIMLLIDMKSNPFERDAVIGFATEGKLDWFPRVKFYRISLEEMDGESIGGYGFFDDDVLDELHLDDIIHMTYYPRSRVILKMEKIGSLREGKKSSRRLRYRPIAEKGQSGDAGA